MTTMELADKLLQIDGEHQIKSISVWKTGEREGVVVVLTNDTGTESAKIEL